MLWSTCAHGWHRKQQLPDDDKRSYLYGPDGLPVEQIEGETATYLHHDQLGSTRLLTNASGEAVGKFTYGPYGKLEASTGSATTPLGFAGQYTDSETGLQYLRARFYDPATGQFMSRDPIEALTRQPYSYAGDNPTNRVDPSGLFGVGTIIGCGAGEVADPFGGCVAGAEAGTAAETAIAGGIAIVAAVADSGEVSEGAPAESSSSGEGGSDCNEPSDTVVLGKYPEYKQVGEETGSRIFDVPSDAWNAMTTEEQWAANQRFLDRAIARGSEIRLATPAAEGRRGLILRA
jgi:RHS repeat-associated protein